jgi:hypothetical protein
MHGAAIAALLYVMAVLLADAEQATWRGFLCSKFSEGARRLVVEDERDRPARSRHRPAQLPMGRDPISLPILRAQPRCAARRLRRPFRHASVAAGLLLREPALGVAAPPPWLRAREGEIAIAPNDDTFKSEPDFANSALGVKNRLRLNALVTASSLCGLGVRRSSLANPPFDFPTDCRLCERTTTSAW